jgi:hypothetical protein
MGALLGFAFSPLGRWVVGGLALLVVAGGLYLKIYSDGAASERARQARESLNNLRNRTETNATVEKLPTPDLDNELNRWMLPDDR